MRDKDNLRIMSIGTGVPSSTIKDYGRLVVKDQRADLAGDMFAFMMDIEVASANTILNE